MIYDCFLFNGEYDLLNVRLAELAPFGDNIQHVMIESKYTFTGIEKPIHAVPKLSDRIRWIPFAETPNPDAWVNEKRTRNVIKTALHQFDPADDDIIILSDLDEIPKAYAISQYSPSYGLCALQMDM